MVAVLPSAFIDTGIEAGALQSGRPVNGEQGGEVKDKSPHAPGLAGRASLDLDQRTGAVRPYQGTVGHFSLVLVFALGQAVISGVSPLAAHISPELGQISAYPFGRGSGQWPGEDRPGRGWRR
jgi:hypothetical protein